MYKTKSEGVSVTALIAKLTIVQINFFIANIVKRIHSFFASIRFYFFKIAYFGEKWMNSLC